MGTVRVDPARFARLLDPRSIAVFGGAQAQEVIRQCDLMGYDGEIWPVHPKKDEIMGRRVYRSVDELPGSPDAAYVGVNRNLTIDIMRGLSALDAGGAVSYATGFAEAGEEGAELTRQLLDACGDMVLVGPNCYGLLNYVSGAMLWPDQQGGRRVERGVAIITASSNVGFNLTMQRRGLPIAYMVSLGNRLKLDLHEAIELFARQERVTAIGLYLEALPDPATLQRAVDVARELGKPIVAIKTGRSQVAQQVVMSHTASLAGSDVLVDALFARLGVARVDSLEALIEALKVLHVLGPLSGGRIAAMSTSGGDLTLLADALKPGLSLPPLSPQATERLRAVVHERVVPSNPFDYQMFSWDDEEANAAIFGALLSDDFDVALCLLDYPRADKCDQSTWGGAERGFVRAAKETGTKGAVMATFSDTCSEDVADRLMEDGVAMLAGIDGGVAAVKAAYDIGAAWSRPPAQPLLTDPGRTAAVRRRPRRGRVQGHARRSTACPSRPRAWRTRPTRPPRLPRSWASPSSSRRSGWRTSPTSAACASTCAAPTRCASALDLMAGLSESYLVERMIEGAVTELIVGVARDPQFGPYLVVGGGGILVELMKDSASLLLPVTREHVLEALGALQCAPLLNCFRGCPQADLNAAADVVMAVAAMVERDPGAVAELDINPLLVLEEGKGAVAADALVRLNAE